MIFYCKFLVQNSFAVTLTRNFYCKFLMSVTVKEFWKSFNIWQSYGEELGVLFFLTHGVVEIFQNRNYMAQYYTKSVQIISLFILLLYFSVNKGLCVFYYEMCFLLQNVLKCVWWPSPARTCGGSVQHPLGPVNGIKDGCMKGDKKEGEEAIGG